MEWFRVIHVNFSDLLLLILDFLIKYSYSLYHLPKTWLSEETLSSQRRPVRPSTQAKQ